MRSAWFTDLVPEEEWLYRETLSQKNQNDDDGGGNDDDKETAEYGVWKASSHTEKNSNSRFPLGGQAGAPYYPGQVLRMGLHVQTFLPDPPGAPRKD